MDYADKEQAKIAWFIHGVGILSGLLTPLPSIKGATVNHVGNFNKEDVIEVADFNAAQEICEGTVYFRENAVRGILFGIIFGIEDMFKNALWHNELGSFIFTNYSDCFSGSNTDHLAEISNEAIKKECDALQKRLFNSRVISFFNKNNQTELFSKTIVKIEELSQCGLCTM